MAAVNAGTVLIIEDEKKISDIVALYLEKEGFRTITADSGDKALKLMKEPVDLIILDLMLPDIQGEELCGIVRERSDVPVIIVTAKSGEDDRIKGLGIGADDYVVKPFSPRELVARVKAQLRRAKKTSGRRLSFNRGLLTIDAEKMEVRKKGAAVVLTPTEYRLLISLAEKPGRVLSRLQLINMVQGYDFEGYDRTVDAHIKNLRHKIEPVHKEPVFIRTIYGVGYKFTGVPDED